MSHPPGYVEERIQVLDAIVRASESYIEVVTLIAESSNEDEAVTALKEKFGISDSGARAVLETQFRRLMGDQRQRLREQLEDLKNQA